ncbi:MAG: Rpn family recombination-promoting nuclease/putative transposase [Spirochaetaceae bacterium]|jgi:hypothetical protein|nr:Rpn family recombination-promoting nuclease/putative transposase [Spirochaetaceae bacterium]
MSNKRLSPKSDVVFKLLFGDRKNTDILAGFLQSVLDLPPEEYETITVIDPHLNPQNPERKTSVLLPEDIENYRKRGNRSDEGVGCPKKFFKLLGQPLELESSFRALLRRMALLPQEALLFGVFSAKASLA